MMLVFTNFQGYLPPHPQQMRQILILVLLVSMSTLPLKFYFIPDELFVYFCRTSSKTAA